MELAFGVLNMSPDDFWNQTLMEWQARVRGFQKSKQPASKKPEVRPWNDAFIAEHNANFKARRK